MSYCPPSVPRSIRSVSLVLGRLGAALLIPFVVTLHPVCSEGAADDPLGGPAEMNGSAEPGGNSSPPPIQETDSNPFQPVERAPIPEAAARRKAEATVEEVFGRDIAKAKTAAEQTAMAEKLLGVAKEEGDATQRYALLNRARTLAVAAGDTPAALRILDAMVGRYQVEQGRAETATLQGVFKAATTRPQCGQLAEAACERAEQAVTREELSVASELHSIALEAARKSGNAQLLRRLTLRAKELQDAEQAHAAMQAHRATLESKPDDPQANLALGKYQCFVRRNWSAGLPMLARSGDAALKALARKELAEPAGGDERVQLADGWWEQAEAAGADAEAMRARARHWYRAALAELTGLSRARAEKRLAPSADAVVEAKPETARRPASNPSGSLVAAQRPLIDRIAVAVKDNKTIQSKEVGFTLGRQPFTFIPEEGGLLVGLDLSVGTFNKISAVRPIFMTSKGQVQGRVIGQPTAKSVRLMAKKGFAVGAVAINGGIGIDGLCVTFMRIEEGGLNPQQAYQSPWFGKANSGESLGGDGAPVVGIFGHGEAREISALGLIQVAK